MEILIRLIFYLSIYCSDLLYIYDTIFNPLTAVSRGSGYKFFVTLYGEPVIRIEHYMQKLAVSRWPGQNDTCKSIQSAGVPVINIGPLLQNRKQNIICYDIYGCTITRIYKKNSTRCISRFARPVHTYFCLLPSHFCSFSLLHIHHNDLSQVSEKQY